MPVGGTNCSTAAGVFFGLNAKEATGESHEPCSRSSCAAGGKGVAWDVEDPSQGHREGLDWDNYVAHWELKEGLAPFTPRIDLVLQRLRERCAHLLPCGKTNTDASRNKKRWFQSRAETAAHQQRNFFGLDAKGAKGKYELDWSEAGDSCNDKGHGVAVPASEPANAAHRPLLTLGLKD
ncbi:hypothetical protein NQZ68_040761 [Dissostichus eleginoides]|nr:hypothetical protein NQZ68_040761 [Dissostichus eleginoides]